MRSVFAGLCLAAALSGGCDSGADDGPYVRLQIDGSKRCSGVLVGARAVLTAAHCIGTAEGTRAYIGGRWYQAARTVAHPDFTGPAHADIGLVLLEDTPDATPLPLADASPGVGEVLHTIGYSSVAGGAMHRQTLEVYFTGPGVVYLRGGSDGLCKGDSGGPQMQAGSVVAINTGGFCSGGGLGLLVGPHLEWLASEGMLVVSPRSALYVFCWYKQRPGL